MDISLLDPTENTKQYDNSLNWYIFSTSFSHKNIFNHHMKQVVTIISLLELAEGN